MDLNKIINLKKERVLIFTCLLYSFSNIYALNSRNVINNEPARGIKTLSYATDYAGRFLPGRDSVPGQTNQEKSKGWEILFDGKNTDKWRNISCFSAFAYRIIEGDG